MKGDEFAVVTIDGAFEVGGVKAQAGERGVRVGLDGSDGLGGAAEGGEIARRVRREALHAVIDEVGLVMDGAEELPVGDGHVKDAEFFGEPDGGVGELEIGEEGVEGFGAFALDEGRDGLEAVAESVLGGGGLAGGGNGSTGASAIGAGGRDLRRGAIGNQ